MDEGAGRRKRAVILFSVLLWLFMLTLNILTPHIADDYVYAVSFKTKEPLRTLADIIPSMYVHCFRMNGRVVSHTIGQISMLLPDYVYDAVNAGIFVLLVYVIYRIAGFGGRRSAGLFAGVFAGLWCFIPNFGQVALWQIGSVNYLWGLAGGFVFLAPYIYRFLWGGELLKKTWQKVLFCILALPFGMYIEGMSFVSIFLAAVLLLLGRCFERRSLKHWMLVPVLAAAAGYVLLMLIPAEMAAKKGDWSIPSLISGFLRAGMMFVRYYAVPFSVWGLLTVLGIRRGMEKKRLVLAAVLVLGALTANFMMTAASYYEARSASPVGGLLVAADAVLMAGYAGGGEKKLRRVLAAILAAAFAVCLAVGVWSVADSYMQFREREMEIERLRDAGETDLTLDIVHPKSPYSAFWGLRDLDTEERDTWPNKWMAQEYGVNSILGR